MLCPKCSSEYLMIRQRNGMERLMIRITGMRKYFCRDCEHTFRAADRRRVQREEDGGLSSHENSDLVWH
jgi:transposase-like protein